MTALLIAIWWLVGVGGGLLLWFDWKRSFPKEVGRCPTRAGALAIAVGGLTGPFILIVGLIVTFIDWVEGKNWKDSWWKKPIC